jgi:hypothetical protein
MTAFGVSVLAALGVIFGGATWWTAWRRNSWRRVAQELGLLFSEESFWWQWSLEGRVRGCDVRVHNVRGGMQNRFYTSILIQPRPALPVDLKIRNEDIKSKALRLMGTDDVLTGDAEFDKAIWLDGAPLQVLSRLDARTREATRRVLGGRASRARVEGGAAHFEHRQIVGNGARVQDLVLDLVGWMERLRVIETEPEALLKVLRHDPVVGVRERSLDILLAQPPAIVQQAVEIGMRDADRTVRLHAALAAGPAGCPILIDALGAADLSTAGAIFKALETHEPRAAREQALRLIRLPAGPATPAAIEAAGRLGLTDTLVHFERLAQTPTCAAAVVDAARLFGNPAAEPALIHVLNHSDAALVARVIDTLGHLGTRAAVAPLRAIRGRNRTAALAAIERIAEREAPGRGGGLSLLADAAGGLSTTPQKAGSLSMPPSERDV